MPGTPETGSDKLSLPWMRATPQCARCSHSSAGASVLDDDDNGTTRAQHAWHCTCLDEGDNGDIVIVLVCLQHPTRAHTATLPTRTAVDATLHWPHLSVFMRLNSDKVNDTRGSVTVSGAGVPVLDDDGNVAVPAAFDACQCIQCGTDALTSGRQLRYNDASVIPLSRMAIWLFKAINLTSPTNSPSNDTRRLMSSSDVRPLERGQRSRDLLIAAVGHTYVSVLDLHRHTTITVFPLCPSSPSSPFVPSVFLHLPLSDAMATGSRRRFPRSHILFPGPPLRILPTPVNFALSASMLQRPLASPLTPQTVFATSWSFTRWTRQSGHVGTCLNF